MSKCIYPDFEGGYYVGKHNFDKDGWCCICGEHKLENNPKEFKKFLAEERNNQGGVQVNLLSLLLLIAGLIVAWKLGKVLWEYCDEEKDSCANCGYKDCICTKNWEL